MHFFTSVSKNGDTAPYKKQPARWTDMLLLSVSLAGCSVSCMYQRVTSVGRGNV